MDAGAEVLTGAPPSRVPDTSTSYGAGRRPAERPGQPRGDFRTGRADRSFNTDDEGIALANDTEFGLVAYAFTESLRRAVTVAEQLETGMVGINQGIVSNPAAPSAASRRPDWVGKAVPRASRSIWKPSTSASACESSARDCQPLATGLNLVGVVGWVTWFRNDQPTSPG